MLFFRKQSNEKKQRNDSEELFKLTSSLEKNKQNIEKLFSNCDDFVKRDFMIMRNRKACIFYFDSMVSSDNISRFILDQLMELDIDLGFFKNAEKIKNKFLPVHDVKTAKESGELLKAVYDGDCIVLIDGIDEALIVNTRLSKGRSVGDPLIEVSAIGPQEGFVEDLHLNFALLRKRIKTSKYKIQFITKGRVSKNLIAIMYIEGIANDNFVKEIKSRIERIDTDGFIDSGHLRRFIVDNKLTPFPQEIVTERPDRCVNHLLEGRIVVMVDGSPFALIYPSVFIDLIKTADEAYMNYYMAVFLQFLRFVAFLISTFGSALYIALTVFNPGMIPTELLITIASSRAGVPFPAFLEALIMEFTFEIIREANIRIPKPIGPSISIVGGLVIGQSVVQAGIVSQAMIIVVALTAISAFAVPGYTTNPALRLIRFPFMIAASFLGMYGIISLLVVFIIHMASIRSVGVPYLSPIAPINFKDIQNLLLQGPPKDQIYRPSFLEVLNPVHTSRKSSKNNPN
ncbi:MAG TPA: spore germination protein [Thermoclostridium sp.]